MIGKPLRYNLNYELCIIMEVVLINRHYDDQTIWEDLANAVVLQAAEDYRLAMHYLLASISLSDSRFRRACIRRCCSPMKDGLDETLLRSNRKKRQLAPKEMKKLEAFFLSEYYRLLTNVPGEYLLRLLREEAGLPDQVIPPRDHHRPSPSAYLRRKALRKHHKRDDSNRR